MSRRRGNGEGSIHYREDKKLWCASVTIGYDGEGKRRRRSVYGRTKAEVLEKLTRLQAAVLNRTLTEPQRVTLAAFLNRWLETTARPRIQPTTYNLYSGLIRNHINPRLGGVLLTKLTPGNIVDMYSDMEREGKTARVRQLVHSLLHGALGQALKWGMVPRNVCDAVDKPKAPGKRMRVLDAEQANRLLDAAQEDRLHALYVLAVTTGLRQGELLGLQWEDVALKDGMLSVQHNLLEINGAHLLSNPKTAKGKRRVELSKMAVTALRDHKKRMLAEGHPGPWVFCDTAGGPLRKSNVYRRSFKPLLKKADLPDIRFHDLRHTAATLHLRQGTHAKVVQEMLGHAQISLTLDTYSHVSPSMQKDAAAKIDDLFAGLKS